MAKPWFTFPQAFDTTGWCLAAALPARTGIWHRIHKLALPCMGNLCPTPIFIDLSVRCLLQRWKLVLYWMQSKNAPSLRSTSAAVHHSHGMADSAKFQQHSSCAWGRDRCDLEMRRRFAQHQSASLVQPRYALLM